MMVITEPSRQIEVLDEVDVLVAGAGVSGCAAAVAAARMGARTMLLERNGVLGGVATAGLMANIGNLFLDRDGNVVIRGIAKEVVERMAARGAASPAWAHREVPGVVIDSEQLKVLLAEMQQEVGVQVLTHTLAARPILEDGCVRGAFIESKTGRHAVLAQAVVDATGEADLAYQAGCPMRTTTGSASVEFKMGGVDLDALVEHFRRQPGTFPVGMDFVKGFAEFERNWIERGILFFPHGGGRKWDIFQKAIERGAFETQRGNLYHLDAAGLYGLRGSGTVVVNSNFWRVDTLDTRAVSRAELECQQACYYVADFFRRAVPGFAHASVVQVANDIGIRASRGIVGQETLRQEQAQSDQPVRLEEAVGRLPARASFEDTGEFLHAHTFDVPYGVLLPRGVENLLVGSGKSVSCDPQGLVRGMAGCMVVGQAAGVAAALAAEARVTPRALDVTRLQHALIEQGADLG
ncbi:MAG: FAD-dependent oxidoreductase [Anaerolineales bacterium]|nr:FAD-dependent oxidoreductase [Anaerolineales bacterium]